MNNLHVIETTNYDRERVYCFGFDRLESVVTFWGALADADGVKSWKIDTDTHCHQCQA